MLVKCFMTCKVQFGQEHKEFEKKIVCINVLTSNSRIRRQKNGGHIVQGKEVTQVQ